jgi:hypothetical protein
MKTSAQSQFRQHVQIQVHGTAQDSTSVVALRKMTKALVPRLRRSAIGAWWEARAAVADGTNMIVFLRHRAADYARRLAEAGWRLPIRIELRKDGELELREAVAWANTPTWAPGEQQKQAAEEKALELATEVAEADAALQAAAESRNALVAEIEHEEHEIRPSIPGSLPIILGRSAVGAAVLAEAFQLAIPWLNMTGVDPSSLSTAFATAPLSVISGFALCALATAVLTWLAHEGLRFISRFWSALSPFAPSCLRDLVAGAGVTCLQLALAWWLAAVRRAAGESAVALQGAGNSTAGAELPMGAFVGVTVLVPWMLACLWTWTDVRAALRHQGLASVAQWDEQRRAARTRLEAAQRALAEAQQRRAQIEADRNGAKATARALETTLDAMGAQNEEHEWLRGEALGRAMDEIRAGLAKDLLYYHRHANRRGRDELLTLPDHAVALYAPSSARLADVRVLSSANGA